VAAAATSIREPKGRLLSYFVLAFSFTWACWWLAVLEARDIIELPLPAVFLGAFGPGLAAVTITAWQEGRAGLNSLLGSVARWRVAPLWYAVALLGPLLLQLAALALHASLGGQPPDLAALVAVGPLVLLQAFYFVIFVALPEEIGWRGFALPRLQARHGALASSVVLGAVWAFWHLPLFFNPSTLYADLPFALFVAWVVPLSVLITWVYNSTGGSVLMVVLLHAFVNASSPMWRAVPEYGAMATLDAAATAHVTLMVTIVLWAAASAIAVIYGPLDLSRRPRHVVGPGEQGDPGRKSPACGEGARRVGGTAR
jgi:membrane protease YdiL (CAAX protease family)